MGLTVKKPSVLVLSFLNLTFAVVSLALHIPSEFSPSASKFSAPSFPTLDISLITPFRVAVIGFVAATLQLILTSENFGNRLFWNRAMIAGGWGMLLKMSRLGVDHLVVSGAVAVLAAFAVCSQLRWISRPLPKTKGVTLLLNCKSAVKNPAIGLLPAKSPRRHTTTCSNLTSYVESRDSLARPVHSVSAGPDQRRGSSNEMSMAFMPLPGTVLPSRPVGLASVWEEDASMEDLTELSVSRHHRFSPAKVLRRLSSCVHTVATTPAHIVTSAVLGCDLNGDQPVVPIGWLNRIARFVAGICLGVVMCIGLAVLVVVMDIVYPVLIVSDLAKVFRDAYADIVKAVA